MARSTNTLLTKQAGEFLVAAELCRRGMFATTFSGNMPHYDILAHLPGGHTAFVQVKTKSGSQPSWVLGTEYFLALETAEGTHVIRELAPVPIEGLRFVFVDLLKQGQDRFYVLRFEDLQQVIHNRYGEWLAKKPRPVINPSDLRVEHIAEAADAWDVIVT